MSIQRRLAVSITLVLLFSLAVGFGLTYEHVLSKVRTKILRRVVADFNGDRHLRAVLATPDGTLIAQSRLLVPEEPAPAWFYRLVVSREPTRALPLPGPLDRVGTLTLETDAHNEVAEAWSDVSLTLVIMALFFAMVLALAFFTIRAALAPLRDVCAALLRIGTGDYSARIEAPLSHELAPLRDGFNAMAARLEEMWTQNRALTEQIIDLQEEERAELARDLHDEVAPFLFAVGADAAMIRQYLAKDAIDDIGARAEAVAEAVKHMQRHLKDVLRRLAPSALLDLGLAGAIDNLVGFWTTRQPLVAFSVEVGGEPLDPPLDAIAFRIVQESVSNAIRHGEPRLIEIVVHVDEERASIVVEDDGRGLPDGSLPVGFGVAGMRERVRAAGGQLSVRNRLGARRGVIVEATLPPRAGRCPADIDRDDKSVRHAAREMDMPA
jgi:two-component system sensor histidine kinase UhpB